MYTVDASTAIAPSVAIGLTIFVAVILIVTYILMSIMLSRIFRKAGVAGWKAWIPVYNTWKTLELGDQKGWWALVLFIPVLNIVATVFLYIAMYYIGIKLGKDGYFVLWAIFLPLVWYVWLAFDKSVWNPSAVTTTPSNSQPITPSM
jgi:hypothetical protein